MPSTFLYKGKHGSEVRRGHAGPGLQDSHFKVTGGFGRQVGKAASSSVRGGLEVHGGEETPAASHISDHQAPAVSAVTFTCNHNALRAGCSHPSPGRQPPVEPPGRGCWHCRSGSTYSFSQSFKRPRSAPGLPDGAARARVRGTG